MYPRYREFAFWTLHDLAVRKREKDRITFEGNHISSQHLLPVRFADESNREFARRTQKFIKSLPRHSDFSQRIAIAFEALRRSGEDTYSAAYLISEILKTAAAEKRAEFEKLGIGYAYRPIDSALGTTQRGRRAKPKVQGTSDEVRRVESIRAQATRYIHKYPGFSRMFLFQLQSFQYECGRDETWYAAAEKSSLSRVAAFEKVDGPFDWWAAMVLPAAAYLYHEQRKFAQALVYYRKGIQAARRAVMHQELRDFVISSMRIGIKLCLRSAPGLKMLPYAGPWLPEHTANAA